MSSLSPSACRGVRFSVKVLSYPSSQLYEEVAYVAFHFHWRREDILELEHFERQRWVAEIGKINQQTQPQLYID